MSPDQAVGADLRRVELDLHLDVLGDRHEGRPEFLDQDLPRLAGRVDAGVVAVPLVGELFERRVLEVSHPHPEDRQEDAAPGLGLDQADEVASGGDAHVEVAVGGQDHPVCPPLEGCRKVSRASPTCDGPSVTPLMESSPDRPLGGRLGTKTPCNPLTIVTGSKADCNAGLGEFDTGCGRRVRRPPRPRR
jgi:hypothetical protein